MLNRYLSRVTSSQRGERFNPLTWPFLLATLAYGVGFTFFSQTSSSLYVAMAALNPLAPLVWGITALVTILIGFTFLLFNIPPAGKVSGLVGFMLWVFAAFCWGFGGGWLLIASIAIPNMWFWFWQYLSLSHFNREDKKDLQTMSDYNSGEYDDKLNPEDGKTHREDNRGVDLQA